MQLAEALFRAYVNIALTTQLEKRELMHSKYKFCVYLFKKLNLIIFTTILDILRAARHQFSVFHVFSL